MPWDRGLFRSAPFGRVPNVKATAGRLILASVAILFVVVAAPVVLRGAPLADDYGYCVIPNTDGLGSMYSDVIRDIGANRPTRLLTIAVVASLCERVPFGVVIAIPLVLTLLVAMLTAGLLRDLGVTAPWPHIGGALWLLQPLGTEAALWPSALHISLGLVAGLAALRLLRRGRIGWGILAALIAVLSVEQLIFALPLVAWFVTPAKLRNRATGAIALLSATVIASQLLWPGIGDRTAVSIVDRLTNPLRGIDFYAVFPATSFGLHSIPTAVLWALPISLVVLVAGAALGALVGPRLPAPEREPGLPSSGFWGAAVVMVLLLNVPVMVSFPHPDAPRVFAPTWLALSTVVAIVGARVAWQRLRVVGGVAGVAVAGVFLSLAFSVSVRVRSADITEPAIRWLATEVPAGGRVHICDVPRTAVSPAPNGDFALHEFMWSWSAEPALIYYEDHPATVRITYRWEEPSCPDSSQADVVLTYDELIEEGRRFGGKG